jgi:alkaline phosphatase D
VAIAVLFATFAANAEAAIAVLGVAAGDASSTTVALWTRAVDVAAPATTLLTLLIGTDPSLATSVTVLPGACTTDATQDFVCKLDVGGLSANTVYFYRFVGPSNEQSLIGRFKWTSTAPTPSTSTCST